MSCRGVAADSPDASRCEDHVDASVNCFGTKDNSQVEGLGNNCNVRGRQLDDRTLNLPLMHSGDDAEQPDTLPDRDPTATIAVKAIVDDEYRTSAGSRKNGGID